MQKGLGVIIATKSKKGKLMTDTVVSCDAKFFSVGSPCVLQTADFTSVPAERALYLCGHGNKRKRTISGYSCQEIAEMLIAAHYTGKQKLYVASCYSLTKKHGLTFAAEIANYLADRGIDCHFEDLATNISIVCDNEKSVNCSSVYFNSLQKKIFFEAQQMLVNEVFPVDTGTLNKKIKSDKGKISNWNKLVNAGGLHPIMANTSSIICMLDGLALFLIYCCIMMYFQCPIGKFSLWLIIPVWIIATLGSYNGLLTCIPLWIPLMAYALQAKTGTLACLLIVQLLFAIVMLVRESVKLFKKVNS